MFSEPRVSIIISSYNYARLLRQAIDGAIGQTYSNTEVICVDDGSSDNSKDVILSYGAKIIAVFKENGGQGSAINAGFLRSSGKIVIFLDSDDVLYSQCAEKVVAAWNDRLSSLHYKSDFIDEAGVACGLAPGLLQPVIPSGNLRDQVIQNGGIGHYPTTANAFSREYLDRVLPMPEGSAWRTDTDVYLCYLAALYGEVGHIDEVLCALRQHQSAGSSISNGRLVLPRLERRLILKIEARRNLQLHAAALGRKVSDGNFDQEPTFLKEYLVLKKMDPNARISTTSFVIDWTLEQAFRLMVASLITSSKLSFHKKVLYFVWMIMIFILPKKYAETLAKNSLP